MTQLSVKDQIRALIELQKIDGQIYSISMELIDKPAVIEQLKQEFEKSKQHLSQLEGEVKKIQVARKEMELELKIKEDDIIKFNKQLSEVKTNKEYTAKLVEIESIKADKSIIEEKILNFYEDSDKVDVKIKDEKIKVSKVEKAFIDNKKKIEEEIALLGDRKKVLEGQRKQYIEGIDPNILQRYEKVLKRKDGLAIVAVTNHNCGGCFMKITSQTINTIKMFEELIECEICQRILYLEDTL